MIMGVLLVPLIGALGIGFEVSNWSMRTRGMQNAADAAALAAATNNSSNYDVEPRQLRRDTVTRALSKRGVGLSSRKKRDGHDLYAS
ncbi:pilus assembly protein TadG-related protein [Bradyrhizobium sp. USDA 4501]